MLGSFFFLILSNSLLENGAEIVVKISPSFCFQKSCLSSRITKAGSERLYISFTYSCSKIRKVIGEISVFPFRPCSYFPSLNHKIVFQILTGNLVNTA